MSELIRSGEGMGDVNEVVAPEKQVEIDRALELASSKSEADVQAEIALAKETWGANFEQYVKDLVADSKVFLGKNYKKMLIVGAATVVSAAIALSGCIQDPFVGAQENTPAPGGTLAPTSEATQAPTEAPTQAPTEVVTAEPTAEPSIDWEKVVAVEIKGAGAKEFGIDLTQYSKISVKESEGQYYVGVPLEVVKGELESLKGREAEFDDLLPITEAVWPENVGGLEEGSTLIGIKAEGMRLNDVFVLEVEQADGTKSDVVIGGFVVKGADGELSIIHVVFGSTVAKDSRYGNWSPYGSTMMDAQGAPGLIFRVGASEANLKAIRIGAPFEGALIDEQPELSEDWQTFLETGEISDALMTAITKMVGTTGRGE